MCLRGKCYRSQFFSVGASEVARPTRTLVMKIRREKERTHGKDRERIRTVDLSTLFLARIADGELPSVITSDHACARNIILVLIQESTAAPHPVQLTEIGQHWNRLAKKNATVQTLTMAIVVHIAYTVRPLVKILPKRFSLVGLHTIPSTGKLRVQFWGPALRAKRLYTRPAHGILEDLTACKRKAQPIS